MASGHSNSGDADLQGGILPSSSHVGPCRGQALSDNRAAACRGIWPLTPSWETSRDSSNWSPSMWACVASVTHISEHHNSRWSTLSMCSACFSRMVLGLLLVMLGQTPPPPSPFSLPLSYPLLSLWGGGAWTMVCIWRSENNRRGSVLSLQCGAQGPNNSSISKTLAFFFWKIFSAKKKEHSASVLL